MVLALAIFPGCTDDGGSADELCQALSEGQGFASVFQDFDPTDAPAALVQLRTARVELGELKDVAPGDADDDLEVEIDYVQALIDALEPLGAAADAAQVAATIQSVTDAHPEVGPAAARLEAFATQEC